MARLAGRLMVAGRPATDPAGVSFFLRGRLLLNITQAEILHLQVLVHAVAGAFSA
jgi:hypothetical protein